MLSDTGIYKFIKIIRSACVPITIFLFIEWALCTGSGSERTGNKWEEYYPAVLPSIQITILAELPELLLLNVLSHTRLCISINIIINYVVKAKPNNTQKMHNAHNGRHMEGGGSGETSRSRTVFFFRKKPKKSLDCPIVAALLCITMFKLGDEGGGGGS